MGKALRPTPFDILPNTPSSTKKFKQWFRTFEYYLEVLSNEGLDKLKVSALLIKQIGQLQKIPIVRHLLDNNL